MTRNGIGGDGIQCGVMWDGREVIRGLWGGFFIWEGSGEGGCAVVWCVCVVCVVCVVCSGVVMAFLFQWND